jgi:hypothetical protein
MTLVRSFKPLEAASLIIDVSQKGTRRKLDFYLRSFQYLDGKENKYKGN